MPAQQVNYPSASQAAFQACFGSDVAFELWLRFERPWPLEQTSRPSQLYDVTQVVFCWQQPSRQLPYQRRPFTTLQI